MIRATERSLAMMEAVIVDGGRSSIAALARGIGMPVSTAHRQTATLVAQGYLAETPGGRHVAGPRLLGLLHRLDEKQVIASVAAPLIDRLAARLGGVVQFGTLENEMVTYRIKAGEGAEGLFTRVGMQLEAYCSAIGKMLLAHLPEGERRAYLAGGPFVPLTPHTITDPAALASELDDVRAQGFALDRAEVTDQLFCIAVPVRGPSGQVVGAVSGSRAQEPTGEERAEILSVLRDSVARIEAALEPRRP